MKQRDKIYLNLRTTANGTTNTGTVDILNPPSGSAVFPVRPIANLSFGIQAKYGSGFIYGYSEQPSPGALNQNRSASR